MKMDMNNPKGHAAFLVVSYMAILVKIKESKDCAKLHCDKMIDFIDNQMQGWLDTDIKNFYHNVKNEIDLF